jgi:predicted transcriptional regulator of viral defense system
MGTANVETSALAEFRRAGGLLRTSQTLRAGVHPRELYRLRDAGMIERLSRGVYRIAGLPPLSDPDLVTVALRVPRAVVALVSALRFHALTTQIPHEVSIALQRGTATPRLEWPPIRVYRFSGTAFAWGVEHHRVDGVGVKVYGAAKTVADCFKFRNRLGVDVAIEALRNGLDERKFTASELMGAARACRVANVIRPYLEALQ